MLGVAPPILLGFAPHCGRCRVLDLQPVLRATGTVERTQPLRHDVLAAELAGLPVDDIAVADVVMLVDRDARMWGAH